MPAMFRVFLLHFGLLLVGGLKPALAAPAPEPAPEAAAPTAPTYDALPDHLETSPFAKQLATGINAPAPTSAAVASEDVLFPVGRWITVLGFTGYTYVDPQAGLSVQGSVPVKSLLAIPPGLGIDAGDQTMMYIQRLTWRSPQVKVLTDDERIAAKLPVEPDWMRFYGPQLPPGTLYGTWRIDPRLFPRYFPDYPDDLQVWVDDGPKSKHPPELVWVRITGCDGDICRGNLLNQPFRLKSVKIDEEIRFSIDVPADQLLKVIH